MYQAGLMGHRSLPLGEMMDRYELHLYEERRSALRHPGAGEHPPIRRPPEGGVAYVT